MLLGDTILWRVVGLSKSNGQVQVFLSVTKGLAFSKGTIHEQPCASETLIRFARVFLPIAMLFLLIRSGNP